MTKDSITEIFPDAEGEQIDRFLSLLEEESGEIRSSEYERGLAEGRLEADKVRFNYALDGALKNSGARNVKALRALIDIDSIKYEDGTLTGLDEQIESIKKENGFLFETGEKKPRFTFGSGRESTGRKDLKGLNYRERLELFKNDHELYEQLKNK